MNIRHMSLKLRILATVAIVAALVSTFNSVAIANPAGHYDQQQLSHEKIHDQIKARLDKLAGRLEIRSSQQALWEDFAKSVEMLANRNLKKPGEDADAATISRYRADRAADFANKLTKIADATANLQSALSEDQRKILNQSAHRFLSHERDMQHRHHEMNRDGNDHGWDQHERGAS